MTDFKVKIGSKEAVLDVQVIVLPLLSNNEKITSAFDFSIECFYHRFSTHYKAAHPLRGSPVRVPI